jgi:tRNA dimethylallyltransferase
MVEEVRDLLAIGIDADRLKYYGLEYKYITSYLLGEISHEEMVSKLNTAIHQFAKRQMTWFRKMERTGFKIKWLDGSDEEAFVEVVIGDS